MLILTRRSLESIIIADHIVITVLGIRGNKVRIGVTAPKDVAVHREEIYQQLKAGECRGSQIRPGHKSV